MLFRFCVWLCDSYYSSSYRRTIRRSTSTVHGRRRWRSSSNGAVWWAARTIPSASWSTARPARNACGGCSSPMRCTSSNSNNKMVMVMHSRKRRAGIVQAVVAVALPTTQATRVATLVETNGRRMPQQPPTRTNRGVPNRGKSLRTSLPVTTNQHSDSDSGSGSDKYIW